MHRRAFCTCDCSTSAARVVPHLPVKIAVGREHRHGRRIAHVSMHCGYGAAPCVLCMFSLLHSQCLCIRSLSCMWLIAWCPRIRVLLCGLESLTARMLKGQSLHISQQPDAEMQHCTEKKMSRMRVVPGCEGPGS